MRKALGQVPGRQALKPDVRYKFERHAVADAVSVWLVEYRAEHGLSQAQLAAGCGVSQPGIARLEAGDVEPKLSKRFRLADALGEALAIQL